MPELTLTALENYLNTTTANIVVITDNGKLPKDGGKRIGYCFRKRDGRSWGSYPAWILPAPPPPEPELTPFQKAKQEYETLSEAKPNGWCSSCGSPWTNAVTDEAFNRIIICERCDAKMKPANRNQHRRYSGFYGAF